MFENFKHFILQICISWSLNLCKVLYKTNETHF